jgi:hypothetical protein
MAKKLRHKITHDGKTVYIFGETDDITDFFPTATVVAEEDAVVKTVTFKGGTRRRFPGGPTHSSGGGTRKVVVGKPATQNTLPGYPIKCEVSTGIGPLKVTRVKQFTLQGPFRVAHQVAKATALQDFILRSPNGKPWKIGETVTP